MPSVKIKVFLGPKHAIWSETEQIPSWLVEFVEESMSEFEVLEMTLHDKHYSQGVMSPLFTAHASVPEFLKTPELKTCAPNVIGNIGEGLGLAALMYLANLEPFEVTRVKRRKEIQIPEAKRTPDFVASLSPSNSRSPSALIRKLLAIHAPPSLKNLIQLSTKTSNFPRRFPIEAKGTMKPSGASLWSGIWQLIEYWHSCIQLKTALDEIGYGIVLHTTNIGILTRSIAIHVFIPRNQKKLGSALQDLVATRGSRAAFEQQFSNLGESAFVDTSFI